MSAEGDKVGGRVEKKEKLLVCRGKLLGGRESGGVMRRAEGRTREIVVRVKRTGGIEKTRGGGGGGGRAVIRGERGESKLDME